MLRNVTSSVIHGSRIRISADSESIAEANEAWMRDARDGKMNELESAKSAS